MVVLPTFVRRRVGTVYPRIVAAALLTRRQYASTVAVVDRVLKTDPSEVTVSTKQRTMCRVM